MKTARIILIYLAVALAAAVFMPGREAGVGERGRGNRRELALPN